MVEINLVSSKGDEDVTEEAQGIVSAGTNRTLCKNWKKRVTVVPVMPKPFAVSIPAMSMLLRTSWSVMAASSSVL
jgi:hypothetical protein